MKKEAYAELREAEEDHFWFRGLRELVLSLAAKHCPASPRILDAGCGTGGLLLSLRERGRAEGIDFSEEALRFCRERGLENVGRENLNDWKPAPAAFDLITCIDVLYHQSIRDEEAVLAKFHRALKPSGLLLLNVPAFEILRRGHDENVETGRRYRKKRLLSLLQSAGFEACLATYRLPVLFPVLLARRFFRLDTAGRDLHPLPRSVNRLLLGMHRLENRWLLSGRTLPFGSSLFAAARKR